jgi:hypothetical protein
VEIKRAEHTQRIDTTNSLCNMMNSLKRFIDVKGLAGWIDYKA